MTIGKAPTICFVLGLVYGIFVNSCDSFALQPHKARSGTIPPVSLVVAASHTKQTRMFGAKEFERRTYDVIRIR